MRGAGPPPGESALASKKQSRARGASRRAAPPSSGRTGRAKGSGTGILIGIAVAILVVIAGVFVSDCGGRSAGEADGEAREAAVATPDPRSEPRPAREEPRPVGQERPGTASGDAAGEVSPATPGEPQGAKALRAAAMDAWRRQDVETARRLLSRLVEEHPSDPAARNARADLRALEVIGKPAPELEIARWFPDDPKPLSSLRGRPVLLVFWATWCPHCRRAMPGIADKYERFRDRGLEVIAVTRHSRGQTDADVTRYIEEKGIPFPVAVDAGGVTSRRYGVSGIPAAALIDRTGKVVWRNHPAQLSDADLDRVLGS